MDRLYVRGLENVHKKLLIQAAACNLALLMRSLYGAGKPRAAHDHIVKAVFALLAYMKALTAVSEPRSANSAVCCVTITDSRTTPYFTRQTKKRAV